MKNLSNFVIVILLASFLGQSFSFETGMKGEVLRAYGKTKERYFGSGKLDNLTWSSNQTVDLNVLILYVRYSLVSTVNMF
jgi:hypothetical protein